MFWVYLWGIETCRTQALAGDFMSRFESTYEELKLTSIFITFSHPACVLSLPMRNWNPQRFSSPRYDTSFESTYEELKHQKCIGCPPEEKCFESTYEELKHNFNGRSVYNPVDVLSLPMRNWNFAILNSFRRRRHVLSLPMRNWNLLNARMAESKLNRFESTYEELKQISWPLICNVAQTFWVYLWGIETNTQTGWRVARLGFESTYEELKHWWRCWSCQIRWHSFESTYEELKLISPKNAEIKLKSFESTYEELKLIQ